MFRKLQQGLRRSFSFFNLREGALHPVNGKCRCAEQRRFFKRDHHVRGGWRSVFREGGLKSFDVQKREADAPAPKG